MTFIKRSTTKIVKATVGERMRKCSSCGLPFVCKQKTSTCSNCMPKTVTDSDTSELPNIAPAPE